jgi:hypothetical protein
MMIVVLFVYGTIADLDMVWVCRRWDCNADVLVGMTDNHYIRANFNIRADGYCRSSFSGACQTLLRFG